jgi:DNA-binding IclR family transcriptional regulator
MARRRTEQGAAKSAKTTNYATPALEKGLDILELLAHQSEGLTKSQLARSLHRSVSEIFRMLLCLERRGYIAQVAEERYSLTLKLFQLVQEHPPTERLIADAMPVMKRLAYESGQSCHLGVLDGDKIVILAQVNSPTSIGFYVKLGSTVDVMEAASGYVILAHQSDEERERTIAEWRRRTGKKVPSDLEVHLERIRKAGYEKRASYQVKGVVNISFPICDEHGSALGALTIPYIEYGTSKMGQKDLIAALETAALEINKAIGGKAPQG